MNAATSTFAGSIDTTAVNIKVGSAIHGTITSSSNSLTLNARNTGKLIFQSGGVEKMRINGTNVGIGEDSPNAKLEVTGDIEDNWAGRFENTNTGGYGILAKIAGTSADERIFEARVGSSTKMLISGDGKATFAGKIKTTSTATGAIELVGGTGVSTTGAFILRQNGDGAGNGMAITSSHATSHRIWKDDDGVLNIGSSANADAFKQDIAGNVTIDGNVGIGNLGTYKLEVSKDGGDNSTADLLFLRNSNSTRAQTWSFQSDTNKDLVITG